MTINNLEILLTKIEWQNSHCEECFYDVAIYNTQLNLTDCHTPIKNIGVRNDW